MGFALGNRCFPPSSVSQSGVLCVRNGVHMKKSLPVMAYLGQEEPSDFVSCRRRAILFVGISVLPLLQLRALALEGLGTKESDPRTQVSHKAKQAFQNDTPQNLVPPLLNGLGWFSSGVLGALYALSLQERKVTDATIESMKIKLKDKEDAIVSLEKSYESKLLNEQEEQTKKISKVKEEQQSLMDQLSSTNLMIRGLGQELESEKRLIGDLEIEIDGLQRNLAKAGEDKRVLEENMKEKVDLIESLQGRINLLGSELKEKEDGFLNLNTSLTGKELELKNFNSMYQQIKSELATACAEIKGLKDVVLTSETELESKVSLIGELNSKVGYLIVERDDSKKSLDAVLEEYNDLKLFVDRKADLDAMLLGKRELEIEQLKKKLDTELNEAGKCQAMILDLTQQREDMREMLDVEKSKINNLKHEIQITQEVLGKSRNESSDLAEQLRQSENQCLELEARVSKVLTEFAEAGEIRDRSVKESKLSSEVLAVELSEAKELLKKTKEQQQIMSSEQAATAENHENLQEELADVYKKAEASSQNLKEESNMVTSLRKELLAMEKQLQRDKEARRSLETELEEATTSLDEMNRNVMLLSRDLEVTNARNSSLETEKELLYKSLTKQSNESKEAQENMEDAHNIAMKLGRERVILDKKVKKREEELATAKGEILRLRSEINSSRVAITDQSPRNDESEGAVTDTATKRSRSREIASSELLS